MSAGSSLVDNPLFVKHVRSRLRMQHVLPLAVIVAVVSLVVVLMGFILAEHAMNPKATFTGAYVFLAVIQGVVLLMMGTSQVASAVAHAKDTGILDFHRIAPLPARRVAVGFLLGAPIREYVVFALTLPFSLICAIAGDLGVTGWLMMLPVILSSTLLFHTLAMVNGLSARRARGVGGTAVGLVILAHLLAGMALANNVYVPGLLTAVPVFMDVTDNLPRNFQAPTFFGADLPMLVQSFLYQVPLAMFLFVAAVRKMRSDRAHGYSKPVAAAFLATIAILSLGTLWKIELAPSLVIVSYVTAFGGMLLLAAVTPSLGDYTNGFRRAARHHERFIRPWDDAALNPWAILVSVAIVAAATGLAWHIQGDHARRIAAQPVGRDGLNVRLAMDPPSWAPIVVAALTLCYYGLGVQFFELRFGRKAQPYWRLTLFLIWVVPLLFGLLLRAAAIQDEEVLASFVTSLSPLAGIAWSSDAAPREDPARYAAIGSALALTAIFAAALSVAVRDAQRSVRDRKSARAEIVVAEVAE